MMKRLVLFFVLICLFLSGCTQKQSDVEVIKFSTWGSASEMAILTPIIKDFELNNPKIKIELLHIPQNYFQKIHLLFASNLAPDVIFINNLNLPVYANYLEPFNIDTSKYYNQSIEALSYNNKLLAVPRDVSNLVIYYNKAIFDKQNISYPNPNWGVNDLLLTAQKLTDKNTFGISYEEDVYYAMPYIITLGGDIDNINAGMMFYKNLVNKYHVAPSKSDVGSKTLGQMFLEGRIAMHLSGRWLVPKYTTDAKFDWGVMTFPGIVPCDASGWAISKSSKHKESAQKFVEYLSSKNNIEKMTKSGLIVPARSDVNFSDKVFLDAISKSKPQKITPDYNKKVEIINDNCFNNS